MFCICASWRCYVLWGCLLILGCLLVVVRCNWNVCGVIGWRRYRHGVNLVVGWHGIGVSNTLEAVVSQEGARVCYRFRSVLFNAQFDGLSVVVDIRLKLCVCAVPGEIVHILVRKVHVDVTWLDLIF